MLKNFLFVLQAVCTAIILISICLGNCSWNREIKQLLNITVLDFLFYNKEIIKYCLFQDFHKETIQLTCIGALLTLHQSPGLVSKWRCYRITYKSVRFRDSNSGSDYVLKWKGFFNLFVSLTSLRPLVVGIATKCNIAIFSISSDYMF